MKLKYEFEPVEIDGETIAVPVGAGADAVSGVLRLNAGAAEILELLKTDTTEADVIAALTARYENDREEIAQYVRAEIDELRKMNFIED